MHCRQHRNGGQQERGCAREGSAEFVYWSGRVMEKAHVIQQHWQSRQQDCTGASCGHRQMAF